MRFREVEKSYLPTGGYLKTSKVHIINMYIRRKRVKVTIPNHKGDLDIKTVKSIFNQAGLN